MPFEISAEERGEVAVRLGKWCSRYDCQRKLGGVFRIAKRMKWRKSVLFIE